MINRLASRQSPLTKVRLLKISKLTLFSVTEEKKSFMMIDWNGH